MDPYFDRKWMSKAEQPPLTLLELLRPAGTIRFFGGPAEYHLPPGKNSNARPPESVEGAHSSDVLGPGEEMETFVCTDGDDKTAVDAIENYHGKLMWRVHAAPGHNHGGRAPFRPCLLGDRRRIHRRRLPQKQLIRLCVILILPAPPQPRGPYSPLAATFRLV